MTMTPSVMTTPFRQDEELRIGSRTRAQLGSLEKRMQASGRSHCSKAAAFLAFEARKTKACRVQTTRNRSARTPDPGPRICPQSGAAIDKALSAYFPKVGSWAPAK